MTRRASAEAAHCGGFAVVAGRSTGVARGSDACRSDHLRSPRRRLLGPRSCERLPRRPGRLLLERRLAPDAGGPLVQQQLPPERRRGRGRPSRRARRRGRRADRRSVHVVLRRVPVPAQRRARRAFGDGGWVETDLGSFDFAHAVGLQRDGGIVVAGEGDCRYAGCFLLARYRPDGSLDPEFGEGGVVRTQFGLLHAARAFDVSIAPDGRIVAAGFVQRAATGRTARTSPWLAIYRTAVSTGASRATAGRPSTSATATTSRTRSRISAAGGSS